MLTCNFNSAAVSRAPIVLAAKYWAFTKLAHNVGQREAQSAHRPDQFECRGPLSVHSNGIA